MKKKKLYPVLLAVFSAISAVVYRRSFAYFNLFLAVVVLGIAFFIRNPAVSKRISVSAVWLLVMEIVAFLLILCGIDAYSAPVVWALYVGFLSLEVFATPRMI